MSIAKKSRKNSWSNEIDDLIRGACGGFLFGIPLIYTMEVWWVGSVVKPEKMLLILAITFIIVFLLNRTAGFRTLKDIKPIDAAIDTVKALAIGIICTTFTLILLREITFKIHLRETVGKIIFESVPFTLGVGLANQVLNGDRYLDSQSKDKPQDNGELHATISDIGATLIGAMVVAFNIAPTDEVPMLAAAVSGSWLLGIIAASLVISYSIVFESGLANQHKRMQQKGLFQRPLSETVMAYLVALLAAAFMLWFFQRLSFDDPWRIWLKKSLILGLPATIGGAAGRLAI
jgi:putative integral membrane protein (TIGR02587 family)